MKKNKTYLFKLLSAITLLFTSDSFAQDFPQCPEPIRYANGRFRAIATSFTADGKETKKVLCDIKEIRVPITDMREIKACQSNEEPKPSAICDIDHHPFLVRVQMTATAPLFREAMFGEAEQDWKEVKMYPKLIKTDKSEIEFDVRAFSSDLNQQNFYLMSFKELGTWKTEQGLEQYEYVELQFKVTDPLK